MLAIVETATFLRLASAIWVDDELTALKVWLAGNALLDDVIPGAQGLRKVRWSPPRHGPSEVGRGWRTTTSWQLTGGRIVLLMAYTKAKFDNLTI